MSVRVQEYATKSVTLPGALETHRRWIESKLGCLVSDTFVIETKLNLSQLAQERILNSRFSKCADAALVERFGPHVETIEIPSDLSPILSVVPAVPTLNPEIFYSIQELRVLAERWRVHYNTVRPHSSLGYRPPAPEAWMTSTSKGHGEVETATRFPLLHTPDGGYLNSERIALH